MKHCDPKHYYYPMRALTEFFLEKESEKVLSKRLNAKDFLTYKRNKDILGRDHLILDFSRKNDWKHELI